MSSDAKHKNFTTTDDSSYADAISETISILGERNLSLSSILESNNQNVVIEEKRKKEKTAFLLDSLDADDEDDYSDLQEEINSEKSSLKDIGNNFSFWMKNAVKYIYNESEQYRSTKINNRQVAPSNNNILHRSSVLNTVEQGEENPVPKITDATDTICSYPNCIQPLNIVVSRFHCRKCNGWYCAIHSGHPTFGMRLKPSTGEPDPLHGVWSRICELCFNEAFYNRDSRIPTVNCTDKFIEIRNQRQRPEKEQFTKLDNRFQRLSEFKKNGKIPFRIYERKVVPWEKDENVKNCQICKDYFSPLIRKHHCRLCGKVICGENDCSIFRALKLQEGGVLEIRICSDCDYILFEVPEKKLMLLTESTLNLLILEMNRVKQQIADIMPRFNDQLLRFEEEMNKDQPNEQKIVNARHEASVARDTIMLLFRHYESVSTRIKQYQTQNADEERIVMAMQVAARRYLQENMFTLQMLPKLDLRRLRESKSRENMQAQQQSKISSANSSTGSIFGGGFSKSLIFGFSNADLNISIPPPANLDALHKKYDVLIEQKGQIDGFLTDAVEKEHFDDVRALRLSLDEINQEIFNLKGILQM